MASRIFGAQIWTNNALLLNWQGEQFQWYLNKGNFSFHELHLTMSSSKQWSSCPGITGLTDSILVIPDNVNVYDITGVY